MFIKIFIFLGYIFHSDLVQLMPADLRKKAARVVAAKVLVSFYAVGGFNFDDFR